MTRALLECIVFLSLSDDKTVNPEAAVRLLEEVTFWLQKMSQEDKAEFARWVAAVATGDECDGAPKQRVDFLRALTEQMGLDV